MDGENNGSKPYEQMDDLGRFSPYFWFNTHITIIINPILLLMAEIPNNHLGCTKPYK